MDGYEKGADFQEPESLPAPHIGVHFNFLKSMQLTAGKIMEDIAVKQNPTGVVMNIKYGFDGSGNHTIYQQLNNEKINNIIVYVLGMVGDRVASESRRSM